MESESSNVELPAVIDDGRDFQNRNGKLSYQDISLLLQLREKQPEMKQSELAVIFNVTQGQISRLLASFTDTTKLAKMRLKAEADRAARATLKAIDLAAERGDATPGLELLDRLDVVAKKRQEGTGGAKVMIVIGGQGNAGLPDDLPTIDVDPV